MGVVLNEEQAALLDRLFAWFSNPNGKTVYYVSGCAGTGKSTIISEFCSKLNLKYKVRIAAFTGRVAIRLAETNPDFNVSTLHRLLYTAIPGDDGGVVFRPKSIARIAKPDLIVVDECSMLTNKLLGDLLKQGCRLLLVGDMFQLRSDETPALGEPDFTLSKIVRGYGVSTLYEVSEAVRSHTFSGYYDPNGAYKEFRAPTGGIDLNWLMENAPKYDIILTTTNNTRKMINQFVRMSDEDLVEGEVFVVLQNNYRRSVWNGQRFSVSRIRSKLNDTSYLVDAVSLDSKLLFLEKIVVCFNEQPGEQQAKYAFGNEVLVDYGYALTLHKAQGSEWSNILYIDDSIGSKDYWAKFYTAITRATTSATRYIL